MQGKRINPHKSKKNISIFRYPQSVRPL